MNKIIATRLDSIEHYLERTRDSIAKGSIGNAMANCAEVSEIARRLYNELHRHLVDAQTDKSL